MCNYIPFFYGVFLTGDGAECTKRTVITYSKCNMLSATCWESFIFMKTIFILYNDAKLWKKRIFRKVATSSHINRNCYTSVHDKNLEHTVFSHCREKKQVLTGTCVCLWLQLLYLLCGTECMMCFLVLFCASKK